MRSASWRTFLFRERGRLDIDALLGFAGDGRSIALLFDGVADVADDVDRLVMEAKGTGLNIVCIAVDDNDREAQIVSRIQSANLAHGRVESINGRLSRIDSARLVDLLGRFGRLGIVEPKSDELRLSHFRGKDLFDSMAQLENAPGFGKRVGDLFKTISDRQTLKTVLIAAYASFVDHQLLVVDAARMVNVDSDVLIRSIQSDPSLSSLLSTDGNQVRTRHRWMAAEPIVAKLGAQVAADMIADALRSVSSRHNQVSVRERNPTALLIGAFMSQRNLRRIFPGADLDQWYTALLDVFGHWSGRYWEQRAILARKDSRGDISLLAKAESFALRAAELVPDAYSYTTLGTVLLEKAARAQVDVSKYYERSNVAFESAARLDYGNNSVVSWTTFLRFSLRVLTRMNEELAAGADTRATGLRDDIIRDWSRIFAQLAVMGESSEAVKRVLTNLRRDFDRAVS